MAFFIRVSATLEVANFHAFLRLSRKLKLISVYFDSNHRQAYFGKRTTGALGSMP